MELRAYGVATTLYFPLIDKGATDFESTPVTIASGDCKISKDGGAFANTTTASFVHVAGGIYSIPLTATEMQAKVVVVKIVDQTGTKEWEDQAIIVATVNHASAEIPSLWASVQDIAANAITATSIASDAITAAKIADNAIDAASIADGAIDAATLATGTITAAKFAAGAIDAAAIATDAIDADAIKTDAVTEIQSGLATASALSTVAGYVDTEVAAIKAKTDNLPSDPASASTIATAFGVTNGKIDAVDDYVDTEVAAIKAKTDLIPASPAAVSDIPTAIQNADALLTRSVTNTEGSAAALTLTGVILKLCSRFVAATGRTYKSNGSSVFMTQTPSTDPGADPVTELGVGS